MHILFVIRHYPPEVSGGARRPFLFINGLRAAGHRVTTVTPFPSPDDHPDHIEVFDSAIQNGFNAATELNHSERASSAGVNGAATPLKRRLRAFLRTWAYWPDPNVRWANKVIQGLVRSENSYDLIVTTSPPESSNKVGAILSQRFGIPWVADIRDAWFRAPLRQELDGPWRATIERRLAQKWLTNLAGLIAVSAEESVDYNGLLSRSVPTCHIGHFSLRPRQRESLSDDHFNLVYTGGIGGSHRERSVDNLIESIAEFSPDLNAIALHIAGPLEESEIDAAMNAPFKTVFLGIIPYEDCQKLQAGSDALLLFAADGTASVPGKMAEYWNSERPILLVGDPDWWPDLASDLRLNGVRSIESGLPDLITKWKDGQREAMAFEARDDRYDAGAAVRKLESFLQSVLVAASKVG